MLTWLATYISTGQVGLQFDSCCGRVTVRSNANVSIIRVCARAYVNRANIMKSRVTHASYLIDGRTNTEVAFDKNVYIKNVCTKRVHCLTKISTYDSSVSGL